MEFSEERGLKLSNSALFISFLYTQTNQYWIPSEQLH